MYIDKETKRGYNEYLNMNHNEGEQTFMDVGLLILEAGDHYGINEPEKEVAVHLIAGEVTIAFGDKEERINRPDPFDFAPYCLLLPRGIPAAITAHGASELYIQKTKNDRDYEPKLYTPQDIHTWARGVDELEGTMRRDVRTVFDYETRPDSHMVLGEVVNPGGKWSSYPPHHHPQPEVYFYYFEHPEGFGAAWNGDGKVYTTSHHGLLIINNDKSHQQVMAPGYPCMYIWGIRHLPDHPWEKTRIDDEEHLWLLEENPQYWKAKE